MVGHPDPYIMIQTHADEKGSEEAPLLDYSLYKGYKKSFFLSFALIEDKNDRPFYEAGKAFFQAYFEKEVRSLLRSPEHTKEEPQWYIDFIQPILDKKDASPYPVLLKDMLLEYKKDEKDDSEKLRSLKTNLNILHSHGLVLYYEEEGLEDIVWLNPQALVKYIQETILSKKIITDKKNGAIAKNDFDKQVDEKTLKMLFLQKVIFLHQPNIANPELDEYIIPNYLPVVNVNDIDYQLFTFGISKPGFIIKFDDFIPFGFINKMICFYGQQPDVKKFWRNQLLFTLHNEARVLIQLDFERLKIKVHFQLLNQVALDEKLLIEYLFFTLMALYWNFENSNILSFAKFLEYKRKLVNKMEFNHEYSSWIDLHEDDDCIPRDGFISLDDNRYVRYKELFELPDKEYRIKSYSIKDGRINKEDVKEIPVSLFAAFTNKKLAVMKNVFISYSHDDIQFRQQMETYLINLKRDGLINVWQDGQLQPGDDWDMAIKSSLQKADICIMLLSQSFIVSNYVHEVEFKAVMENRKSDNCRIIPVLIKACDWKNWKVYPQEVLDTMSKEDNTNYKIASFQFLPLDENQRLKPLNKWQYPEDAWLSVEQAIRSFCKEN